MTNDEETYEEHKDYKENKTIYDEILRTTLKGVDLTSSHSTNLVFSMEDLEGCIVSYEHAIGIAVLWGLVIKEE